MTRDSVRAYYEQLYGAERIEAFPADEARYRSWFGRLLESRVSNSRILDFGCGVGHVSSLLAAAGADVTGVDISSHALDIARNREPRATFREIAADGGLPFDDGIFDLVACLGVLEHIPDPEATLRELRRVAKEGAIGLWVVPNRWSPYFWFGHGTGQVEEHPRSLQGWRELLVSHGWDIHRVRRDPGPLDRPVAAWKRISQATLNRLPIALAYQFVFETRAATHRHGTRTTLGTTV